MTMSGWSQSQNVQFISVLFDFLQIHMAVQKQKEGEMMTDDRLLSQVSGHREDAMIAATPASRKHPICIMTVKRVVVVVTGL